MMLSAGFWDAVESVDDRYADEAANHESTH